MSQPSPADLARCRDSIDQLDMRLLELLNERTTIVQEIGRIKQQLHLAIYEPKREEQVFANVLGKNSGPLSPEAVKRIFERIIDEMRTIQKDRILHAETSEEEKSC
jgi:chorismate mutase-like protein